MTAVAAAMIALPAQAQTVKYGQVGPFTIDKISEGGKFDRCAATLSPGPKMLRIAWTKDHVYTVSVPPAPGAKGALKMTFQFGKTGNPSFKALTDGKRTWATIDTKAVERLMKVKGALAIDVSGKSFLWPLGTVKMEDVIVKVEDCVWKAHGR